MPQGRPAVAFTRKVNAEEREERERDKMGTTNDVGVEGEEGGDEVGVAEDVVGAEEAGDAALGALQRRDERGHGGPRAQRRDRAQLGNGGRECVDVDAAAPQPRALCRREHRACRSRRRSRAGRRALRLHGAARGGGVAHERERAVGGAPRTERVQRAAAQRGRGRGGRRRRERDEERRPRRALRHARAHARAPPHERAQRRQRARLHVAVPRVPQQPPQPLQRRSLLVLLLPFF